MLAVSILLNVVFVFNSFPIIWAMTEGGPAGETDTLVTYLYKLGFRLYNVGAAAAVAIIIFGVLLVFAVVHTRLTVAERAPMTTPTTSTGTPASRASSAAGAVLASPGVPPVPVRRDDLDGAQSSRRSRSYPPIWFPAEPVSGNFLESGSACRSRPTSSTASSSPAARCCSTAWSRIPAGFALARFRFPGRQLVPHAIIATQMFSPVVLLLASFRMMIDFGLLNTYWSLILVNATVALPFTIWMMTAYFSTIPREIEEAAILDGAGRWRMLFDHFLPISMPGIVTAMTFSFVIAWNEFLFALTFITDQDLRPLTTGIYSFVGRYEIQWHFLMAASIVSIVPVFIGFLLVQRRLVSGLTAGAVK